MSHYFLLPTPDIKHNLISCSSNNATILLAISPVRDLHYCFIFAMIGPGTLPYLRTLSEVIYRAPGFLAVVWFGSSPTPSTVRKLSLFLSHPACGAGELTDERRGGGGAKSSDRENAWPSINHSILSVWSCLAGSTAHSWELTRGTTELVQHFRLKEEITSAQKRCLTKILYGMARISRWGGGGILLVQMNTTCLRRKEEVGGRSAPCDQKGQCIWFLSSLPSLPQATTTMFGSYLSSLYS